MAIHKETGFTSYSYHLPEKNRLNPQQLRILDNELKRYFYKVWVNSPVKEEIELLNTEQWLKDRGAKNKDGAIVVRDYKTARYSNGRLLSASDCEPILYEQLMEDLAQWKTWRSKVAYAKAKEIEELEQGI